VKSCSLLEPDACADTDSNGEIETVVYGEIVQMKQDRVIPIFTCQVVETIVLQYCRHLSSAGVTRYTWFREPNPIEPRECRQAGTHGKVVLRGHTIQATVRTTISHDTFLSRILDDNNNCEV
jgi:hypothetical protein